MDSIQNPYTPGAGARPHQLVGRERYIADFQATLQRAELRRSARSKVLFGLRGVGKTVLLRELASDAKKRKWIVVSCEASRGEPILPALTHEIFKELRNAERTLGGAALQFVQAVFKSFTMKIDPTGGYSFDVDPAKGFADSGDVERDLAEMLQELAKFAAETGVGLLIAVDELQDVELSTLRTLNSALHRLGQEAEPLPFILVGAGLPSLRGILAEATSYTERLYEYWPVGPLDDHDSKLALAGPAADQDVEWQPDALVHAQEFARGYPYFIQVLGQFCWDFAIDGSAEITRSDVVAAVPDARSAIDAGLYEARWQRATRTEQRMMKAMATCNSDGRSQMSDLVAAMNKDKLSQLSIHRANLIAKGIAYAPDRGELAFTVPGMAQFVDRQIVD